MTAGAALTSGKPVAPATPVEMGTAASPPLTSETGGIDPAEPPAPEVATSTALLLGTSAASLLGTSAASLLGKSADEAQCNAHAAANIIPAKCDGDSVPHLRSSSIANE
jgi:hypothetical protein